MKSILIALALVFTVLGGKSFAGDSGSRMSLEAFGGAGGFEDLNGYAVGGAGVFYLDDGTGPVRIGFRPEYAYHDLDGGHDHFITGNFQIDLVPEGSPISVFGLIGGGVDLFKSDGAPLFLFPPTSSKGGVLNLGGGAKIHLGERVYLAPAFTYIRGFGDVAGNNFRATGALGFNF